MAEQETFAFAADTTGADKPAEESSPSSESRPEWLDEKFQSTADLQDAYHELEQKFVGGEQQEEQGDAGTEAAIEAVGVEAFAEYSTEYLENGELSEKSYQNLQEQYNFTPELVNAFIVGQEAVADKSATEVYDIAGGKENYTEILEWAGDNLPEDDIDSYNEAVQSGNNNTIRLALRGLMSQYNSSNPSLVAGTGKATHGGYASKAEMMRDMGDPKYQEDAAFRKKVESRLMNTPDNVI